MFRNEARFRMLSMVTIVSCCGLMIYSASAQQENPIQEQFRITDGLMDGRLSRRIKNIIEREQRADHDFNGDIRGNAEIHDAFIELIVLTLESRNAPANDDWSGVLVLNATLYGVVFEAIMSEVGEGERLEGFLLEGAFIYKKTGLSRSHHVLDDFEKAPPAGTVWAMGLWKNTDLRLYQEYLRSHSVDHCDPLIEYILLRDPHKAMQILFDIFPHELNDPVSVFHDWRVVEERLWLNRSGLLADHPGDEFIESFNRLAKGPEWWTRLYCLSIVEEDRWVKNWFIKKSNLLITLYEDEQDTVRLVAQHYAEKRGLAEQIKEELGINKPLDKEVTRTPD